ncbi:MAG: hypothetical protein ACRDFY_09945 [Candidatus Limnocylindria bacterium]
MTFSRLASLCPWVSGLRGAVILALVAALAVTACDASTTSPTPEARSASPSQRATPTPNPTPSPSPTPLPTPRFTNEPDDELAALIPPAVNGVPVVLAPFEEFALTPGDLAIAYGELGNRFASLVLAYVERPRTSLYAVRVHGEPVATKELEPHLATAARYVGIAGLDPEPWEAAAVGGHQVWVRPEDNATAAGTHIYTWSSGEFVFLLIGVDDGLNRALIELLPGEPAPSPTPMPSADPSASPEEPSPTP